MKGCIKHSNLRCSAHNLHASVNAVQVRRIMQRCNFTASLNTVQHITGNQHAVGKALTAMHNTMAYSINLEHILDNAIFLARQRFNRQADTNLMVRNFLFYINCVFACWRMLQCGAFHTDAFNQAFGHDMLAFHVYQLILDGGAATIYYENNHNKPPGQRQI